MITAAIVLTLMGSGLGLLLGFTDRLFAVETDPMVDRIANMMPGSQCGQCGFPGCRPAAEAIANGHASVSVCPPGGRSLAEKLAEMLGVSIDASALEAAAPMIANIDESLCTGCTRCFKACPTDAIVGANLQIHAVYANACTGCAKCKDACPEDCISLAPQEETIKTWSWPRPHAA